MKKQEVSFGLSSELIQKFSTRKELLNFLQDRSKDHKDFNKDFYDDDKYDIAIFNMDIENNEDKEVFKK